MSNPRWFAAAKNTQALISLSTRFSIFAIAILIIVGSAQATNAATITVNAGDNLQAAINAAAPGDTLLLQPGATFTGTFTLPNKGASTEWITIRSAAPDSALPPAGSRISPSFASQMPTLLSPGSGRPALQTAPGAHHYRLLALRFSTVSASQMVYDLVRFGDGDRAAQTSLSQVPHDLTLDRSIVAGHPTQEIRRGVALHSAATTITGCWIADIHQTGTDSQGIGGWNGPGPFRILNNYIEAAGENIMFGGAVPGIVGLVPSDIEVRGNYLYKPLRWRPSDPSYAGIRWSVKNLFELKSARRVVVEGNVMENCWGDVNAGYGAVNLTVRGDSGAWATIEEVEFRNNVVRHVAQGVNVLGRDTTDPSGQGRGVRIVNNVFADIDGGRWSGDGYFVKVSEMEGLELRHNTVMHAGTVVVVYGAAMRGFVMVDNIMRHNAYGVLGVGQGIGNSSINAYFPGAAIRRNIIIGADANIYPPNNFYPRRLEEVGFVNLAGGNYRLAPNSQYRGRATDRRDIGCDIGALEAATAGVTRR